MKPMICTQCGAPLAIDARKCEYCGTVFSLDRDDCGEEAILYADERPVEILTRSSFDRVIQAVDHLADAMASTSVSFNIAADRFQKLSGGK